MAVSRSKVKNQETQGNLDTSPEALIRASRAGSRDFCDSESQKSPWVSFFFTLLRLTARPMLPDTPMSGSGGWVHQGGPSSFTGGTGGGSGWELAARGDMGIFS